MLGRVFGLLGGFIVPESAVLVLVANDGPRECLGIPREPMSDRRGVGPGSGSCDLFLIGTGVFCSRFAVAGASDNGGDGGVGASDAVSDFGGGVDAVGDRGVIPLASLPGLRARRLPTASDDGRLDRSSSIVC